MSNVRRINLVGGPCSGKSTLASYVYSQLKMLKVNVELTRETIKNWIYLGCLPESYDQLYLFASQIREEDLFLRTSDDAVVVTDAPIDMSAAYGESHGFDCAPELASMADKYEKEYPSYNIFVLRDRNWFTENGRIHNYRQSLELDQFMLDYYRSHGRKIIGVKKYGDIMYFVRSALSLDVGGVAVPEHLECNELLKYVLSDVYLEEE